MGEKGWQPEEAEPKIQQLYSWPNLAAGMGSGLQAKEKSRRPSPTKEGLYGGLFRKYSWGGVMQL